MKNRAIAIFAAMLSLSAPAAFAQDVDLTPAAIAAVAAATATAVNDDAAARASRSTAPRYSVFVDNFTAPVEMTISEIVAAHAGQTILVSPAANGAALGTCAGWRAEADLVVWNTGGQRSGICPGDTLALVGDPVTVRAAGKLTGISLNNGTGPRVIPVPNVALSNPTGYMSIFISN